MSGNANGSSDRDRADALTAARLTFEKLAEDIGAAGALSDVFAEVGEAVMAAGDDGQDQLEAGFEALEPRGDEDDAVRAGLLWLVEACGGYEDEPAPRQPRAKKGKRR